MATTFKHSEKMTVTLPYHLKHKLTLLKDELSMSMSAIYQEALEAYIEAKEKEKWDKGIALAAKDDQYLAFVNEIGDTADVYGY
jgi:predicted transcriptional regulator